MSTIPIERIVKCCRCGYFLDEKLARIKRCFFRVYSQLIGGAKGRSVSVIYCKKCKRVHSLADKFVKEFDAAAEALKADEIIDEALKDDDFVIGGKKILPNNNDAQIKKADEGSGSLGKTSSATPGGEK